MTKIPAKTHGEDYERFGRNLAAMRNKIGLSQYEIAEKLGMLQSTYAGYETGTRKIPLSVIVQLSKFFNVEAGVLIGLSDYVPPKQPEFELKESEKNLISTYRKLNREGKQKLCERADELLDLGYIEKGDAAKMA
ncbi:MAG: helix-turn-helix transcriptional regulator [Lachnospiraceae bacterium]|nr:helix-turn-helix transcriptional regulator [Lachnospiraceae bacterium]